jgi:hypothetical protein
MSPVDESAKVTDSGALPLVGLEEKSADGGAEAVTARDPKIPTIEKTKINRNLFTLFTALLFRSFVGPV